MKRVLIAASVISFIEWFNKENVDYLHRQLGCEVHIACDFRYMADTDVERTEQYVASLKEKGILLHQIDFDRSPLGKKNKAAYKQLKKVIADYHFDLIHCHTPTASVLVRMAAKKARKQGTTVMYTCHGFHFHNAAPKKNWMLYYPVERFLSRKCDYLVTINKEDYKRAQTFHTKNVRYIPGVGVNISRIADTVVDRAAMKESIGVPADGIMILSVGEMIERKNHQVIIKALGKLQRKDIYYVICGKGPLREELATLADELGIGERTLFLGFRRDIPELCNTADISAFPSRIEGLGLAGIEAMAAGVPLVSSNVHGILDYVIDGETGYACAPDDVDGFARAIQTLADSPELRASMKEKCLEAVKPFEINNALEEMWSIYREILQA
jgi:glycosyltransferase involved in cell wall biosynthesis